MIIKDHYMLFYIIYKVKTFQSELIATFKWQY